MTTTHIPFGRPLFSLLEGVAVTEGDGRLTVSGPWGDVDVADRSPLVRLALYRMVLGPVALYNIPPLTEEFARWKSTGEHGTSWRRLRRTLDALGGYVVPSICLPHGTRPVLSLTAVVPDAVFTCRHVPDHAPVEVGNGAAVGDNGSEQVLCGVGSAYHAVMHRRPAIDIVKFLLTGRSTIAGIADALRIPRPVVGDVVAYLAGGGFVTCSGSNGTAA